MADKREARWLSPGGLSTEYGEHLDKIYPGDQPKESKFNPGKHAPRSRTEINYPNDQPKR